MATETRSLSGVTILSVFFYPQHTNIIDGPALSTSLTDVFRYCIYSNLYMTLIEFVRVLGVA